MTIHSMKQYANKNHILRSDIYNRLNDIEKNLIKNELHTLSSTTLRPVELCQISRVGTVSTLQIGLDEEAIEKGYS